MTSIRDREAYLSYEREEEKRKSGEDDLETREAMKSVVSNRSTTGVDDQFAPDPTVSDEQTP